MSKAQVVFIPSYCQLNGYMINGTGRYQDLLKVILQFNKHLVKQHRLCIKVWSGMGLL